MELLRQIEFFNPHTIHDEIHIIGLGAIGSHIVEALTRMGIDCMDIYDFDTVSTHNIPNQMFFDTDIGKLKTEAIAETCFKINPELDLTVHEKGYTSTTKLSGYVFICVDSISLRKEIVTTHRYNPSIKAMFDFRMGLESAQHYAAAWNQQEQINNLLKTMDFTDEEAKEAMPVSACGSALCVLPTIRQITSLGVANFMNFVKTNILHKVILADAFNYTIDAFKA